VKHNFRGSGRRPPQLATFSKRTTGVPRLSSDVGSDITQIEEQTMSKQTITAFFDTRSHAEHAALALKQAGLSAADVSVSPETARDDLATTDEYAGATGPKKTGFWASLEEMFGGSDDHGTYTEGLRRGGTMLTVHVDEAHTDKAIALLEQHGAVDLEEREGTWRSEGWSGGSTSPAMATSGAAGFGAEPLAMTGTAPAAKVTPTETRVAAAVPRAAAAARTAATSGKEDVLRVVEEQINIGKRAVRRGKVRLHSYVVEKAVSENVTLRDETVSIDRHAVDRPVAVLGADAFKERTIEMEEVDEEAVVGKTARVVEEIGIRKDVTDRTETIRDTVRSTKVDVDDGRTVGSTRTGYAGDFASRLTKGMEVVGSDGQHVGMIDQVDGATMRLKRMDPASGGQHHSLPIDLVKSVDKRVMLSIPATEAKRRWTAA